MRRVLLISPHFPPDSSAGTHRVRLLAPHLQRYGWDPTVLTLDTTAYEGQLDPELPTLVPASLRVVRCPAWPVRITRRLGIGDLGLRSFTNLYGAAARLLRTERFDAIFITIFPSYTALLGPLLVRRFKIPFVLDYQDPWVNAWGVDVGGGAGGTVDFKSRISRALAVCLEPRAVRAASAITAVSAGTYEPILQRNPRVTPITEAFPVGAEPGDFTALIGHLPASAPFDPADGLAHVCYTGTLLPLGVETLTAVLRGVCLLRDRRPDLYARLRLHFIGTSNQTVHTDRLRVVPLAREMGLDGVREIPTRLPYSETVRIQKAATALLAMGSSELHYTASKIFPLLLAKRPLLAVYHERSTSTELLRRIGRAPSVNLVTYSDTARVESQVEAIFGCLASIVERPTWYAQDVNLSALSEFFAENIAGRLAGVLDRVAAGQAA